MNIKPIRNDVDLRDAFKRLEPLYQAQEGSAEADEMEICSASTILSSSATIILSS